MPRFTLLLLTLLTAIGPGACDKKSTIPPSGKTVKIGIIAPFTGTDRAKGIDGLKGIKTALRLDPYLDNGDAVELVVEDDRDDPERSVAALKKLAEVDQVAAVLTLSSSGPVLQMAAVADDYRTPILALLATHPDITRGNRFISQLCFDDDFQGAVAALFMRDELLVDRVAVFSDPESAYSSHLAKQFIRKFESLGGKITDAVTLSGEDKNLEAQLKRVQAKRPELVYLPIKAGEVVRMARLADAMGWLPNAMVSDGLLSTVLAKYKSEANLLDGLLASDFFSYEAPLTPYGKKVELAYKGKKSTYALLGVEGYAVLAHALNRCRGPRSRACINQKIRTTVNFTGLMGRVSIGSDGKALRPLYINAIRGGRMRYIVKVY